MSQLSRAEKEAQKLERKRIEDAKRERDKEYFRSCSTEDLLRQLKGQWAAQSEIAKRIIDLKEVLQTRPHIPNKEERKEARQEKAKEQKNGERRAR